MLSGNNLFPPALVCALCLALVTGLGHAETPQAGERDAVMPIDAASAASLPIDIAWPRLEGFYQARQGRYVWHAGEVLTEQGERLYRWLAAADREGLTPADYHVNQLRLLMDESLRDHRLLRELLLTDGYLRLARDLRLGLIDPARVDPLWEVADDPFEPLEALDEALRQDRLADFLDSLGPASDAYARLREALARYRAIEAAGGWEALVLDHSLRPDKVDPAVRLLRQRLALESPEEGEAPVEAARFDSALSARVRRFQQRFGLQDDGVVGPKTLRALNVPVETRINQILANLERWRWLPHRFSSEYLLVNTAGFEVDLVVRDQVVFHARTVNGSLTRQTPSFDSRVTHLVVNPQWTVPRTIAVQDMLPRLQQDASYLPRNRIRVYRRSDDSDWAEVDPLAIDWSVYHQDNFPFVLKQDAGQNNSLGRFKFHMPNPYAVYLHDTPAVGLFEQPNRALSSGCVRVEGADRLAELLIRDAGLPDAMQFNRAMRSGESLIAALVRPVPVYITYFTSWVDASGEVNFRPDIYTRDGRLMLALGGGLKQMTARRATGEGNAPL